MAFNQSSSFHKILMVVFGVAFGLVALALGYQAMNNSADIRSKAAEEQSIYKQWEFNGTDAEGWMGESPYIALTQNGYLRLVMQKFARLPVLRNFQVNARLPKGLKTIAFSMAVGGVAPVTPTPTPSQCPPPPRCATGAAVVGDPRGAVGCPKYVCPPSSTTYPTPSKSGFGGYVQGATDQTDDAALAKTVGACTLEAKLCPDGSYVGRSGAKCDFVPCVDPKAPRPTGNPSDKMFIALIYYKLANKSTFERPLEMRGVANGKFQEYKINLPDGGDIAIERLRIVLISALRSGDTIYVDWIRLLGPVVRPSVYPTPTPGVPTVTPTPTACYTGLKEYVPNKPTACSSGYSLGITFTCWDGYTSFINEGTVCYSIGDMKSKATVLCAGRSNCPGSTGGPRPSTTPSPVTPTPTPACHTECNVLTNQCQTVCSAPVSPSTPTPTPPPYFIPAQ